MLIVNVLKLKKRNKFIFVLKNSFHPNCKSVHIKLSAKLFSESLTKTK
jgi:hypothetical protein